ncbi:hypothetical protein ACH5RR_023386 [Cinchona calisaya]|uniref:Uncharacterized protein n=1 Tax=Cinchona calisaya TaxID=153742 RepID=A0ABD2ZBL9_9GENT
MLNPLMANTMQSNRTPSPVFSNCSTRLDKWSLQSADWNRSFLESLSQTIINLKENISAIVLRSGKEVEVRHKIVPKYVEAEKNKAKAEKDVVPSKRKAVAVKKKVVLCGQNISPNPHFLKH